MDSGARPAANLVFLIDVSGSMESENKLGLVKYGLRQLVSTLCNQDRVSIVTYAGNSGLALPPTNGLPSPGFLDALRVVRLAQLGEPGLELQEVATACGLLRDLAERGERGGVAHEPSVGQRFAGGAEHEPGMPLGRHERAEIHAEHRSSTI